MKKNQSCLYGLNIPCGSFQKLLLTLKIASMILICSFLNLSATATNSLNIDELQQQTVSGKVTDSQTGQNLPGVNIQIKGTVTGVNSDVNGNYVLPVKDSKDTLIFSFIGYVSKVVPLDGKLLVNVTLDTDVTELNEIVVIGYGTSNKKDLTGSVSIVPVANAKSVSTVSVSNMIEGRSSGVDVSTRTAQPGSGVSIQIRGAGSPLYVIDGVPISNNAALDPTISGLEYSGGVDRDYLATINPADIESISILKDASATAIYGSAAANGVILITTKKGKAGDVSVAYSGSYSVQTAKPYYPVMDATTFMQQADRLSFERYLWKNEYAPYSTTPYTTGFTPYFSATDIANAGAGTDWVGLLLRTGSVQEHNISISGGSEKVKTFASFNYYDNKGILKNSSFRRYTGRMNVDYEAKSWLKVGTNLSYTSTGANNASTNDAFGASTYPEVQAAVQFPPNIPYDPKTFDIATHNPYDNQFGNPMGFLEIQDYSSSSRIFVTPNLELKILPNFKLKVQTGYDGSSYQRDFYMPGAIKNIYAPDGLANNGLNKNHNFSSEEYLTYDAKIGSFQTLNVVLGVGYYKSGGTGFQVASYNFFTDAFGYNNIGIATNLSQTRLNSSKYEHTKFSQFGRVNYSVLNKYIVTFTIRNDGSSTFAENKKYGLFPAGAVTWKVGEEQFIKNLGFISDLKLRVSYGATGNEAIVGNYPLTLYGSGANFFAQNGAPVPTVSLTQIGNPNITWETDVMANLGLDFGFFNDRLWGTLEFYRKTARNLLNFDPLPLNAAIENIASNVGSRMAQGFDFNLESRNLTGKFTWETDFNISYVKSNWVTRNPRVPLQPWEDQNDEIDVIYGWKTNGIIKSSSDIPSYMPSAFVGNIKYVDVNGDNNLDQKDVVRLGNLSPRWNIGMNNTFSFMNFDLSVFIYGKFGLKRFDGYTMQMYQDDYYTWKLVGGGESGTSFYNGLTFVKDIWTHDNPNGHLPGVAPDQYSGNNPSGTSNFYLLDGSFIRIKNIKLGYQLPESLIKKTFINRIRFYVDFDNIAVITNWKGLDPEIQETSPYPQVFTSSFGVNVNF